MPERYIAFDVETPNSANDRMSAIGVTVIEDGRIIESWSTLVNPECSFHPFNIALTGITPAMAAKAPTFPELWPSLEPLFDSGLLIAHNAPFDMSVLAKCLGGYGIRWRRETEYACTCRMGRRCFPDLPNHRLDTLCRALSVPLNHHEAGSDSRACAELLLRYLEKGIDIQSFRRRYDLLHARTVSGRRKGV